jgi:hypothetical protein
MVGCFMLEKWKYWIASAIIFFILVVIGFVLFKPSLELQQLVWIEEPIKKTHKLSLLPGELYVYSYRIANQTTNITYIIRGSGDCIIIDIAEANEPFFCVNADGNDKNMSNLTLNAPFSNIFRPWMLAVEDGWHWRVVAKSEIAGREYVFDEINFSTIRKEKFKGRQAYVVVMNELRAAVPTYFVIDDEKRILLKEYSEGYEITLLTAPFSLEQ